MSVVAGMMKVVGGPDKAIEVVGMRNEFEATCAMCAMPLGKGQGIVHTRGHRRPYPVVCDSCMYEADEMDREAAEAERDFS